MEWHRFVTYLWNDPHIINDRNIITIVPYHQSINLLFQHLKWNATINKLAAYNQV